MSDTGFIKLYRKMLDNPVVCKDADHVAVWIYLLLSATWQQYEVMFEGKIITLEPGQLVTGRLAIGVHNKINEYKVQRILKRFENEQLIAQQTTPRNRLISVLNWNQYQSTAQQDEQQAHNNCTTTAQQSAHKQEVYKNIEEDKEYISMSDKPTSKKKKSLIPTIEEVIAYCQERNNGIDPHKFYDHYESNGWMVGKNKMKDWKASVRTWERNSNKNGYSQPTLFSPEISKPKTAQYDENGYEIVK